MFRMREGTEKLIVRGKPGSSTFSPDYHYVER